MSILEAIFRPKIKSKKRNRRSFKPDLLSLEGRQLLDGTGVGAGYIWNRDPTSTVVGGKFSIQVTQENGLPYAPGTVASTTWTIPGAYSGYTVDNTGYHPQVLQTVNVPGDTISGYWSETPGTRAVAVTVNFVQPTWQGAPIVTTWPVSYVSPIEIAAPTVNTSTNFGTTNLVTSGYSGILYGGSLDPLQPGISTRIDVTTPNGAGGSFGVIQTLDPTLDYYVNVDGYPEHYKGFVYPDGSDPGIFLDKLPTSNFPYYNGTVAVGNTLFFNDLPSTTMYDPRAYRMEVTDHFTDTIMYTPPGGIPVPISTASWGYDAKVVRSADGTLIFSPFTPKTNPSFLPNSDGTSGWTSGSTAIAYPQWNAKVSDYMPGGNTILVKVALAASFPAPGYDLENYFYSIGDPYDYWSDPYPTRDPYGIG